MRAAPAPLLVALASVAVLASPVLADWPSTIGDNLVLDSPSNTQKSYPHFYPDPAGIYLTWQDYDPASHAVAQRAIRLAADGTPATGWTAAGVVLPVPASVALVPDGIGGFYATWADGHGITLARIGPDGTPAPGWPAGGVLALSPLFAGGAPSVVPDGTGGTYVLWLQSGSQNTGLRVKRYLPGGVPAPGWALDGYLVGLGQDNGTLIPDGAGGTFVLWFDTRVHAHHLTGAGLPAAGWESGPLALSAASTFLGDLMGVPDTQGGLFLAWRTVDPVSDAWSVSLQRVTGAGLLATGWPAGGLGLAAGSYARQPLGLFTAADGSVLALFTVAAGGHAPTWALRVAGDATIAAGWPSGGRALTPGTYVEASLGAARTADGGVMVTTQDWPPTPSENRFTSRRFDADGLPAAGWTADGVVIADAFGPVFRPNVGTDADGAVLLAWDWTDSTPQLNQLDLKRMRADGTLGGPLPLAVGPAAPARLALAAPQPNPAPGRTSLAFSLPTSMRASLAIYDLSGRRVRALEDGVLPAGTHERRWDGHDADGRALPAGLYLVRLTTAAGAATRRVALLP